MPVNPKKLSKRKKAARAAAAAAVTPAQDVEADEDDDRMQVEGEAQPSQQQVFKPGVHSLEEGEELDYDRTAYDCLHKWSTTWPCLSFDVIKDNLGGPRSTFPHTAFLVAGTQAPAGQQNSLEVMKLSELGQGEHGRKAKEEDPDEMDEDEEDDEEEHTAEIAKFDCRTVAQKAVVNRVRCMPQQPGIVAVWGENHEVSTFNLSKTITTLTEQQSQGSTKNNKAIQVKPMQSHKHATEGFALAWSAQTVGCLASGDCEGNLHVWDPKEGGSWAVSGAYEGHGGSVEDIQWSPAEATVFATACVDKKIRVYDTRARDKAQIEIAAHEKDVNVLSWNALTTFMLASGADDNHMKVWDLRALDNHIASFNYHSKAITSIEWCPHESSMLATTSEDHSLAVWDLALERDQEEEASIAPQGTAIAQEAPPQLLFLHAGLTNPKELHWHPQIPGMLAVTAADGFNLFKPSNVFDLTDQEAKMR